MCTSAILSPRPKSMIMILSIVDKKNILSKTLSGYGKKMLLKRFKKSLFLRIHTLIMISLK